MQEVTSSPATWPRCCSRDIITLQCLARLGICSIPDHCSTVTLLHHSEVICLICHQYQGNLHQNVDYDHCQQDQQFANNLEAQSSYFSSIVWILQFCNPGKLTQKKFCTTLDLEVQTSYPEYRPGS